MKGIAQAGNSTTEAENKGDIAENSTGTATTNGNIGTRR
jgi:hypothetical protein